MVNKPVEFKGITFENLHIEKKINIKIYLMLTIYIYT